MDDIFADSDSDSAYDESSPSTCDEPMEVDPPPATPAGDSKDAKPEDEPSKPVKRKIFQEVPFPSSHKLDHRHQHEFVGAITLDNKITLGMAVLGMRTASLTSFPKPAYHSKGKLRYDVAMLELLSGEAAVYSLKEHFPRRNEAFLLDKRVYMNSEVYHYSNPRRYGHVSAVSVSADAYIPTLNRIIAKVPIKDENYVLSVNSNYWRSSPFVILRDKRGRVSDAAYTLTLKDKDGKRLKILASVANSHNKVIRIREHKAFSSPIVPGDKIRLAAVNRNWPPEWLDEPGTFVEGEEYIVEDIVLSKIGIRWEPSAIPQPIQRFGPFLSQLNSLQHDLESSLKPPGPTSALHDIADKTSLLEAKQQVSSDNYKPPIPIDIVIKKLEEGKPPEKKEGEEGKKLEGGLDLDSATLHFLHGMETAMQSIPGPSGSGSGFKFGINCIAVSMDEDFASPEKGPSSSEPSKGSSSPSSNDTASACIDSPIVKRRCPDSHFATIQLDWLNISDLQDHSLLPMRREVVLGSRLKLTGEFTLLTPESYYNSLIPDFENFTKMGIERLETKEDDEVVTFNEPVYADVILRHTKATVEWFDGATETGINPAELHRARKMNHPTETNVYRNMLLKKEKTKPPKEYEKDVHHISQAKEFGLVTKVSQEKMLTVRWFKKDETDSDYIFQGEEIMSQYDNIKHHLFRIPLDAHVYYACDGRDPQDIYNCVARVTSMNEDGTQTITYLDGRQTNVWPGEAQPIDSVAGVPLGYASEGMMFDLHAIQTNASLQLANLSSSPMPPLPSGISSITFQPFDSLSKAAAVAAGMPPNTTDAGKIFRRARCFNPTSPETRFIEFLKRSGHGGYNTTRGINYLAAIFVVIEPAKRTGHWSDTRLAQDFENFDNIFAEGSDLKDAYDLVKYTYDGDTSEEAQAAKAAIVERHPEYEERIKELFAPTATGVPLVVKLIYEIYKSHANHSPIQIKVRYSFGDDREHGIMVVFPVTASQEAREWLDKAIIEPDGRASYYSRHKIVFSFISTQGYSNFRVPEGKGVYICYTNAHFMGSTFKSVVNEYWKKFETGPQCLVAGTLRNVQMFNDTRIACEHVMQNKTLVDLPNPTAEDDYEQVIRQIVRQDEILWRDSYHHAYYSKLSDRAKTEEAKKDKVDRLDFELEELAVALKFDHNDALARPTSPNTQPGYFFKGEMYPEYAMPRAIVLQVSPNLNAAVFTDSFFVFQIMHQIMDCPVWPEINIHLHPDCSNTGTLSSNFALALILLRHAGLLPGPYFNIVDVQNLADAMKEESFRLEGEYVARFGLETVRQLRNCLYKMCSLSCIKFWTKLNIIEQGFGIHRLLETVKAILNGNTAEVIPFKDLAKVTEECTDLELREHLAAIQLTMTPPPPCNKGSFKTLDAVTSHSFLGSPMREMRRDFVCTVKKEHKLLRELPEGVHVIAFANRLDLLRALIMGPVDTPYEGVPFLFDILLGTGYPQEAPRVKYVSLTSVAINPNLYVEGTVCLSLLGTWKGENQTMRWIPGTSNILQVVCSIQVEILMEACPYFNEPGFEARRNSEEGKKAAEQYNGQVLVGATEYFAEIMKNPTPDFGDLLRAHSFAAPVFSHRLRGIMDGQLKSPFPIDLNDAVRLVVRRNLDRLDKAARVLQDEVIYNDNSIDTRMTNLNRIDIFNLEANKSLNMFSCGNPGSECGNDDHLNSYVYLRHPL